MRWPCAAQVNFNGGEVPGERSLLPHSSQETIDESGIAVPVLRSAFGGKPAPTPSYTTSSPFSLKFSDATPLGAGPPPWFDPFQDEDARLAFFASLAAEGCLTHFKTYNDVSLDSFRVDTASLLDNLALHMMKIVGWQKEANGPLGLMKVVKHASSKQHVTVSTSVSEIAIVRWTDMF